MKSWNCIVLVTDRDEDGTPDYNERMGSGLWTAVDTYVADYADTDGDGTSDLYDTDIDNDNNGINGIFYYILCDILT